MKGTSGTVRMDFNDPLLLICTPAEEQVGLSGGLRLPGKQRREQSDLLPS